MTKVILSGCSGKMGHAIVKAIDERNDCEIACGVDAYDCGDYDFTVYKSFSEITEKYDAIIDFSNPAVLDTMLDYAVTNAVPAVICTTGFSEEQIAEIKNASEKTAIFYSGNMSLGINTLLNLLKSAAKVLAEAGFDMEIVEKHHKHKLDAPSGTALALADSMNEALGNAYHYTYDRSGRREERDPKEIGISAVRGGNIVGEHEVIFAGTDEVIEFKHTAYSKAVFGKGAVQAAKFLAGREPGLYDMQDVIAANA